MPPLRLSESEKGSDPLPSWLKNVNLIASLLISINYCTYFMMGMFWFTVDELSTYAIVIAVHLLLYGVVNAIVPMYDMSYGTDRQTRMAHQGGHTKMLAYFVGHGPLAEAIMIFKENVPTNVRKYYESLNMHTSGIALFRVCVSWWAIRAINLALDPALEFADQEDVDPAIIPPKPDFDQDTLNYYDMLQYFNYASFIYAAFVLILCNLIMYCNKNYMRIAIVDEGQMEEDKKQKTKKKTKKDE